MSMRQLVRFRRALFGGLAFGGGFLSLRGEHHLRAVASVRYSHRPATGGWLSRARCGWCLLDSGKLCVVDGEAERFGVELHGGDVCGGAGHPDGVVVADMDADLASGHVHGDVAVAQADSVGNGGCGAAAGAGGQGVAGAALPDFDLDVVPVDGLEELDVGALGEFLMYFDGGSVAAGEFFGDFGKRHDAVGVADVGNVHGVFGAVDGEELPNVLIGLFGAVDGDVIHSKADMAHVDGDCFGTIANLAADDPTRGVDGEGVVFDGTDVEEIAGENTEAVAAFFGFGAVRIHDAQPEIGLFCRQRAVQDAVGAEAEVAVADADDVGFGGKLSGIFGVEDEIVVSECVIFCEVHVFY